jgi:regulatory protein YycH of two-component signal transduction system YycFG
MKKEENSNTVKNIIIITLVIVSLAQTYRLWFGVNANYNFFYALRSLIVKQEDVNAEKIYLASPYRLISRAAANDYRIKYNGLEESIGKYNADLVLEELLLSGTFVSEYKLNWANALRRGCLIYSYPVFLSPSVFAECILQSSDADKPGVARFNEQVSSFNYIVFIPAMSTASNITVLVVNDKDSSVFEYSVRVKAEINDNLRLYIEDGSVGSLPFISSAESGITTPDENMFIPVFPASGFEYAAAGVINPYRSQDGEVTIKSVESQIKVFFEDSPIKQVIPDETGFRYVSDNNAVVKYNFLSDVLEYSNYASVDKQKDNSLVANYSAALKFIRNDHNVINDFYLDSYFLDGERYTFYFNYAVSDFPLIFPDSVKVNIGMGYCMEISVERQEVVKYKRIAACFTQEDMARDTASLNFYDFLNTFYDPAGNESLQEMMNRVRLGYRFDENMQMLLNWTVDLEGRSYMRPAK